VLVLTRLPSAAVQEHKLGLYTFLPNQRDSLYSDESIRYCARSGIKLSIERTSTANLLQFLFSSSSNNFFSFRLLFTLATFHQQSAVEAIISRYVLRQPKKERSILKRVLVSMSVTLGQILFPQNLTTLIP
jgi:hypothetical protein